MNSVEIDFVTSPAVKAENVTAAVNEVSEGPKTFPRPRGRGKKDHTWNQFTGEWEPNAVSRNDEVVRK